MTAQMTKCKFLGYRCLPHRLSPMVVRSNISDGLRPYYLLLMDARRAAPHYIGLRTFD